jgi:lysophospholipid hydrolase
LPNSFYEGGGLQYLRQRFEGAEHLESDDDYFGSEHEPSPAKIRKTQQSKPSIESPIIPMTPRMARTSVQAGDLHSSTGDVHRLQTRSYSILNTPHISRHNVDESDRRSPSFDDFDLREEVMSCIAKSIGLLRPPLSGNDSVEGSPAILPSDSRRSPTSGVFTSSFSSLSLLDLNDDASSLTGTSVTSNPRGYMSGLDNEVEMLFFPAGSILARAGENNPGKYLFICNMQLTIIRAFLRDRRISRCLTPGRRNRG